MTTKEEVLKNLAENGYVVIENATVARDDMGDTQVVYEDGIREMLGASGGERIRINQQMMLSELIDLDMESRITECLQDNTGDSDSFWDDIMTMHAEQEEGDVEDDEVEDEEEEDVDDDY